ncbi:MAG: SGNH/GDSL hydrolase family protein [Acidimicrobiales bacterium]
MPRNRPRRSGVAAVARPLAGAAFVLAGLGAAGVGGSPGAGAQSTTAPQYYVSVGDSYAAGYQPTSATGGHSTTNGFAYQVVRLAAAKGYHYKLVNFGCGGATTTSILTSKGCARVLLGPGAPSYPTLTQAAAAEQFIRAHKGRIGLITVSIGGNDVTACATSATPIPCVATAVRTIRDNLSTLVNGLRSAAGPKVRIVGTTYPDVILGEDLSTQPAQKNLATLSVVAFKTLINPALKAGYLEVGGQFVDVTAATGAYGPLTATTMLAPYGTIPVPVAKVCELTYFCQYHNIHPRTAGYTVIAKLVAGTLPRRS